MPLLVAHGHQMLFSRLSRKVVNCAVVPDPSERTTGVICRAGRARPPLSAVIAESFQFPIFFVKVFASVSGDRRRSRTCEPSAFLRLYMNDVPAATIGR